MLSPRTLTFIVALPAVTVVVFAGVVVMTSDDDRPSARPPDAPTETPRWVIDAESAPIPSRPDAWPILNRAGETTVEWWHEDSDLRFYAEDLHYTGFSAAEHEMLRGYLRANTDALRVLDEAIAVGHLAYPPPDANGRRATLSYNSRLMNLKWIEARLAMVDGRPGAAIDAIRSNLKMGWMLSEGQGSGASTRAIGQLIRNIAASYLVRLSHDARVQAHHVEQMLNDAVSNRLDTERFIDDRVLLSFRSDALKMTADSRRAIAQFDHGVEKVRDSMGDGADFVVDLMGGMFTPYRDLHRVSESMEDAVGIEVRLVDLHATQRTLDRALTAAHDLASAPVGEWRRGFIERCADPIRDDAARVEAAVERFDAIIDTRGAITSAEADQIATALENGIGREAIAMTTDVVESFARGQRRNAAGYRAETIRLALRLYEMRHGKPAPTLASLVDAGILESVPLDPYDHQPMRYDPKRGVIWSVDTDGHDDGGVDDDSTDAPDRVWTVAPDPPRQWPRNAKSIFE